MANVKLSPEVLGVLNRSEITGNVLVLPPGQLDRPLYEAVNKALVNAGGKWTRGKGHVFPSDPRAKLGLMLETGVSEDEQKKFQAFHTPDELAARVALVASVDGHTVLEPSAGDGSLVRACLTSGAKAVKCIELNPENRAKLEHYDPQVTIGDFLAVKPLAPKFARVVMNPPFTKGQDVKHVKHALTFLAPGGLLVAIVSAGSRTEAEIKPLADTWEEIDAGTFKSEGTNVKTILLTIQR